MRANRQTAEKAGVNLPDWFWEKFERWENRDKELTKLAKEGLTKEDFLALFKGAAEADLDSFWNSRQMVCELFFLTRSVPQFVLVPRARHSEHVGRCNIVTCEQFSLRIFNTAVTPSVRRELPLFSVPT